MKHRAGFAGVVLLLAPLAGCHKDDEQPNVSASPAAASEELPTPGAGTDAIGGSVTRDLGRAPLVALPKSRAPRKLLTKDIVVGTGAVAGPESAVTVRYVGMMYGTGKLFHSSWTLGRPESLSLNGYIVGFADGVAGMRVGGRREIVVPPSLAYGAAGYGSVGPNATLVFVVDLVSVN
jgi:peptidylprolyl isomerase